MCSSSWLLGVESSDFSHAEKERTACKAEQVHKLTTICTQNGLGFREVCNGEVAYLGCRFE